MFFKCFVRGFAHNSLQTNRISVLTCLNGIFFRPAHTAESVLQSNIQDGNTLEEKQIFKRYLLENNNFKNPVLDISNLNFPIDNESESLKLLFKLQENLTEMSLWDEVLNCLTKEVKLFDLKDFLKVIAVAGNLTNISKRYYFFKTLIISLSNEIESRKYTVDERLEILFILRHTRYFCKTFSNFRFQSKLKNVYLKLHVLEPYQVAHLFYHFDEFSTESRRYYKYAILNYVRDHLSRHNTDEMGIIMSGLVKARLSRVDIKLVEEVTKKTLKEMDGVTGVHLYFICKYLESCASEFHSELVSNFQEQLIPHLSKFKTLTLTATLLCNHPKSLNLSLWDKVLEKFLAEPENVIIAQYASLTTLMTSFSINCNEFLQVAIKEVEKRADCKYASSKLLTFCKNLVIRRIYSKKILDIIFSDDFIKRMVSGQFHKQMRDWGFINNCLKIDKPELSVKLDEKTEKKIVRSLYYYLPDDKPVICPNIKRRRLLMALRHIYGCDKVIQTKCLHHFDKAIVMRFDRDLNALPIPEEFDLKTRKPSKKPLDDQLWLCMNLHESLHESNPLFQTYMRHYSASGFKPLLLNEHEFMGKYVKKNEEVTEYLKNEIETALKQALQEEQTKE